MIEEESFLRTKLKNYAFFLLRKKSWTKAEFRQRLENYLRRRKKEKRPETETWVEEILQQVVKIGLLDDEQFARQFISHSLSLRKKGLVTIRQELKRKGLKDEIIKELFQEREGEEMEPARRLIEKYRRRFSLMAQRKGIEEKRRADFIQRKLKELLARRGFSWVTINKVLRWGGADDN